MGKMRKNREVISLVKVGRNREAVQFFESVHVKETERNLIVGDCGQTQSWSLLAAKNSKLRKKLEMVSNNNHVKQRSRGRSVRRGKSGPGRSNSIPVMVRSVGWGANRRLPNAY